MDGGHSRTLRLEPLFFWMKEYISSSLGNETLPNFFDSRDQKMQITNHSKKADECSKEAC